MEARELALVGNDGLLVLLMRGARAAYVSIGKHTSAYVSIRQHR